MGDTADPSNRGSLDRSYWIASGRRRLRSFLDENIVLGRDDIASLAIFQFLTRTREAIRRHVPRYDPP